MSFSFFPFLSFGLPGRLLNEDNSRLRGRFPCQLDMSLDRRIDNVWDLRHTPSTQVTGFGCDWNLAFSLLGGCCDLSRRLKNHQYQC